MDASAQDAAEEARLVAGLKEGDSTAFDALFERLRRPLLAYAAALTRDRQLAEDIVQEAFVELARRAADLHPDRPVSPWLFRVARNRSLDALRRRKREKAVADAADRADAASGHAADGLEADERRERMDRLLNSLPPAQRELLIMRFYGDLKFREIAASLRRPLGTVLWQARRGLQRLAELMGDGDR